ncbi:hypothetical protein BP6252_03232 [Coleophoma cylindrospora]|uniref:Uncharacterized protein n=1 Tax=Coleophoma cylindrospora TaxID=1849047 RepID=A0A3D8S7F0_9HELO|nr:hypothetical protein BP6252_03232 [Coleophoma cylindrospora]
MGILSSQTFWWRTLKVNQKSGRGSLSPSSRMARAIFMAVFLGTAFYMIFLLISLGLRVFPSSAPRKFAIPEPGVDLLQHFTGSKQCGITQADLYVAPQASKSHNQTPFCNKRAALLTALSSGGRHGWDEPFVGQGCTYRWFATHEICMILERFNTLTFLGDTIAGDVYTALNILLREDLAFGGLQQWSMGGLDKDDCACEKQFLNEDCAAYRVRSSSEVTSIREGEGNANPYLCERVPHTYIPVTSVPASGRSRDLFQNQTYFHSNPWQPSPVILSLSQLSSSDVNDGLYALEEWLSLATGAERNIPFLILGPPAIREESSQAAKRLEAIASVAKDRHLDVLGLWNMTLPANSPDGWRYGERDALVQAVMVVNWLAMLPTS